MVWLVASPSEQPHRLSIAVHLWPSTVVSNEAITFLTIGGHSENTHLHQEPTACSLLTCNNPSTKIHCAPLDQNFYQDQCIDIIPVRLFLDLPLDVEDLMGCSLAHAPPQHHVLWILSTNTDNELTKQIFAKITKTQNVQIGWNYLPNIYILANMNSCRVL